MAASFCFDHVQVSKKRPYTPLDHAVTIPVASRKGSGHMATIYFLLFCVLIGSTFNCHKKPTSICTINTQVNFNKLLLLNMPASTVNSLENLYLYTRGENCSFSVIFPPSNRQLSIMCIVYGKVKAQVVKINGQK